MVQEKRLQVWAFVSRGETVMFDNFIDLVRFPNDSPPPDGYAVLDDRIPYDEMYKMLSDKEYGDPEKLKMLIAERARRDGI